MGPEGNIFINSPISTFQQGLTHSAVVHSVMIIVRMNISRDDEDDDNYDDAVVYVDLFRHLFNNSGALGDLDIRIMMMMTMMMVMMMTMMFMPTCSGTCLTTVAHSGTL